MNIYSSESFSEAEVRNIIACVILNNGKDMCHGNIRLAPNKYVYAIQDEWSEYEDWLISYDENDSFQKHDGDLYGVYREDDEDMYDEDFMEFVHECKETRRLIEEKIDAIRNLKRNILDACEENLCVEAGDNPIDALFDHFE